MHRRGTGFALFMFNLFDGGNAQNSVLISDLSTL